MSSENEMGTRSGENPFSIALGNAGLPAWAPWLLGKTFLFKCSSDTDEVFLSGTITAIQYQDRIELLELFVSNPYFIGSHLNCLEHESGNIWVVRLKDSSLASKGELKLYQ
jgi:hypothetical protein